jgi:hypothetical protein
MNIYHKHESEILLEKIRNEKDPNKRFQILKHFFIQKITKNIDQDFKLINTNFVVDFEQYHNTYSMIYRSLFLNVLSMINVLMIEKGLDELDLSQFDIRSCMSDISSEEEDLMEENDYSICNSINSLSDRFYEKID